MEIATLEELLKDELKDLYSAESQLVKALPRMVKRAVNDTLRTAFQEHLEQTKGQLERLNEIAGILEMKITGKKCRAMEGILEEGKEMMECDGPDALLDAALIGAAQRVEHYEIAAYGTARAYAEKLGQNEVADLLSATLQEESDADERLSAISEEEILPQAIQEEEDEEDEDAEDDDVEDVEDESQAEPSAARRRRSS